MVWKCRHNRALALLLSLCLGMTGCFGNSPMMSHPHSSGYGPGPQGQSPPYGYNAWNPNHAHGAMASPNGIQRMSFSPKQYLGPNTGGMPPGHPGEFIVEGPQMSGPVMAGMMSGGNPPLPTEKGMVSHPPHRVAPPDVLYLEALRLVPRGPYRLEPLEVLAIEVTDTLPKQDIRGNFMIAPEGTINLGFNYGSVRVQGMTIDQAQNAIRTHLGNILKSPTVNIALVAMRQMQNVRGEHLVQPDGTISLGMYGSVYVAGMTLGQIKCVVETHLSHYMVTPQVSVSILAFNSRKIYIIADGAGYGQQVIALPSTAGETVLDAISRVQGLPAVASKKRIWVARPSPAGHPCSIVLPVDWEAITQAGRTETNYQLFPGDRIYIASDCWISLYNYMDKVLAPVERVLGVTLLASSVYQSFRGTNNGTTGALIVR